MQQTCKYKIITHIMGENIFESVDIMGIHLDSFLLL
jgi:hypothetical protein